MKPSCECSEKHVAIAESETLLVEDDCFPWQVVETNPDKFAACLERARSLGQMDKAKTIHRWIAPFLNRQDQEVFVVVLLDVQLKIRGMNELARGARDQVLVPLPDLFRYACLAGASAFIVAHNHPSGDPSPSKDDRRLTRSIADGARAIDMLFLDHIICGRNGYYSFSEQGGMP